MRELPIRMALKARGHDLRLRRLAERVSGYSRETREETITRKKASHGERRNAGSTTNDDRRRRRCHRCRRR